MRTDLFIIGNGFDLGHSLPSSYNNFKRWLLNEFPNAMEPEEIYFLEPTMGQGGTRKLSDEDAAKFIIRCIDDNCPDSWCNFETALGEIEWSYFFDVLPDVFDKKGDIDHFSMEQDREAFAQTLDINCNSFSYLFSKWIQSIKCPKTHIKSFFTEDKKADSLFLNFNYTKTLEDVYEISPANICHIHGIQGSDIVIGHGQIPKYHDGVFIDRETDLDWKLHKPTRKIFEEHKLFFDRIRENHILNVYSWGFSFSDVDNYYIQQIISMLNTEHIT